MAHDQTVQNHSVLSATTRFRELGNLNICAVGKGDLIVYLIFFSWEKKEHFCLQILSGMKEMKFGPDF